jgi:hypothetical protein
MKTIPTKMICSQHHYIVQRFFTRSVITNSGSLRLRSGLSILEIGIHGSNHAMCRRFEAFSSRGMVFSGVSASLSLLKSFARLRFFKADSRLGLVSYPPARQS